jgi:DNA mismatch endonuclease (patch repair protein)
LPSGSETLCLRYLATRLRKRWGTNLASKNTKPEVMLQDALRSKGLRFRTHDKTLPGTPDIVLQDYPIVIFVHGCYWHKHDACQTGMKDSPANPLSHLIKNAAASRDVRTILAVQNKGLYTFVAWECHIYKSTQEVLIRVSSLIDTHTQTLQS